MEHKSTGKLDLALFLFTGGTRSANCTEQIDYIRQGYLTRIIKAESVKIATGLSDKQ